MPKLSNDLIERIAVAIRGGCYVETAVVLCGISKQTFYRWLKEAHEDGASPLLQKLSDAVERAMAEAEARDVAVIDRAAQDGVWQAAAWRLERKHSDRWGRQAPVEIQNSSVGAAYRNMSQEELDAKLNKLVNRMKDRMDQEEPLKQLSSVATND